MAPIAKPVLPAECFSKARAPAAHPVLTSETAFEQPRCVVAKDQEDPRAQVDSRSTSSGTATPLSSAADSSEALSLARRGLDGGLEFGEARVGVKNTFIQVALGRSPSLDGFFEERHTRSCPPSRQQSVERLLGPACEPQPPREGLLARAGAAAAEVVAPERCSGLGEQDASTSSSASTSEPSPAEGSGSQKQVLILGNVLKQPELGSPELPTVGSAQHRLGGCKPCAFAHTKGCENGVNCAFCHLCQPGERKRRQRQRTARQPEQQRPDVAAVAATAVRPGAQAVVANPVLCQPMMSRPVMTVVDSPVATPVVNNWQPANLCMVPVFRFC